MPGNSDQGRNGQSGANGSADGKNGGQKPRVPKGIWIQFPDVDSYYTREQELLSTIADSDGNDNVVIYLKDARSFRVLPPNFQVKADSALSEKLGGIFGRENVKIR